jgi:hypothetical protein
MSTVTVETSCGQTFETPLNDMPTRMLEGLLVQNGDRPDVDPSALAAMRAELEARKSKQR